MTLKDLIDACIAAKSGNKEFALFFTGEDWRAEIGNTAAYAWLGESEPEFRADADTPEEAVAKLLHNVTTGARHLA